MSTREPIPGDVSDDLQLWQQADAAFDTLLDLPTQEREIRLAAMKLSPEVRIQVEKLLKSDSELGPLDEPGRLLTGLGLDTPKQDLRGREVGEWTLGEELGRGGMSVVYQAERKVGGARQTAALKLLTVGALAGHGRERFLREQSILARLEHPHIAGLLDAGVLDDGTPWMAMACIEGVHIDTWCRQHKLDTRAIVQLFVQVCDTVDFAHRNLVIHRDIKPSNVLVDGEGHVYLLDFGIARLIEAETEHATHTVAVTPRYAAPEQFVGAHPATTMDVYGLGALLYCLLTGKPPPNRGIHDLHAPMPLASRACAESGQSTNIAKSLRGDLDALMAKALSEEPRDRYATPGEMAADLRNWQSGRPVLARKQGTTYRMRKFIGRHRLGVAASALVLLAVIAGASVSLWQAGVARANAAQANAVKDFMVQIFEASGPDIAAGEDPTASVLLQRGAKRVREQFADQPALLAQMLGVIGETQQQRGFLDDATASLDDALANFGQQGVPSSEYALALKARASVHYDRGELKKALDGMNQADEVAADSGLPKADPLRVEMAVQHANFQIQSGQPEKAEPLLRELLTVLRAADVGPSYSLAYAMEILGASLDAQGKSEEAVEQLHEALTVQRALTVKPTLECDILNDLGITLFNADRLQEGIDATRRAITCADRYYGKKNLMTQAAMGNLAWFLSASSKPNEAETEYAKLLPLIRSTTGGAPSADAAITLGMMALARNGAGRADALDAMQLAWQEVQQLDNPDGPMVAWIRPAYGLLLFERGLASADTHLGAYKASCDTLGERTPTTQRICIAQLLLASDQGQCLLGSETDQSEHLATPAQRPWLAAYWLVRQRCTHEAAGRNLAAAKLRQSLDSLPTPPDWLAKRLVGADGTVSIKSGN